MASAAPVFPAPVVVKHVSQLIVAPEQVAQAVAIYATANRPFRDCYDTNARDLLTELGCRPTLVYSSAPDAPRTLQLYRVPAHEVRELARLDHEAVARLNQLIRASVAAILLQRDEKRYLKLYAQAVSIARTAVELNQALFARVEYIERRAVN